MPNSGEQGDSERKSNLNGLKHIFHALRNLPDAQLDKNTLSKHHIEWSTSLEKAGSQYFTPFKREALNKLHAKAELLAKADAELDAELDAGLDDAWDAWPSFDFFTNEAHAYHLFHYISRFFSRYLTDKGEDISGHGPWDWRTTENSIYEKAIGQYGGIHDCGIPLVFDNADFSRPHIGCMIIDGTEMDQRLLWSEVLSAVGFMIKNLSNKEYERHRLAPVFILTIAGKKARVLVAHFDTRLVIQTSNIIDLSTENIEGVKYLQRWSLCEPKGNTLCHSPVNGFR